MSSRLSTADRGGGALIGGLNYFILRRMPLAEDQVTSRYRISAYGENSVTVNEVVYRQSLVLTAEEILSPWEVSSLDQLNAQTLEPVLALQPAVVLLGTGARQRFPTAEVMAYFGQRGIGLEVMDNGALCRTFNILIAEDRAVVAAILIGSSDE